MKIRRPLAVTAAVILVGTAIATKLAATSSGGEAHATGITAATQVTKLASTSLLLSIASTGKRLVAVGERGHILLSDDNGGTWRQASVPANVTLTTVRFASASTGWAVGHSGLILQTRDGGETWTRQFDGIRAAQATLLAAEAGGSPERIKKAKLWIQDGPDKPFLALLALDEQRAFVFGAYGLSFMTDDGGTNWTPMDDRLDNPKALHIYGAALVGKSIFLAGEQGLILRSDDGGNSFRKVPSPYDGSLFDIFAGPTGDLAIIGLRGHAYRSVNGGDSWAECGHPGEESLMGGIALSDGRYVLVTAGGHLLVGDQACRTFSSVDVPGAGPLAGLTLRQGGELALVGAAGYAQAQIPPYFSEAGK